MIQRFFDLRDSIYGRHPNFRPSNFEHIVKNAKMLEEALKEVPQSDGVTGRVGEARLEYRPKPYNFVSPDPANPEHQFLVRLHMERRHLEKDGNTKIYKAEIDYDPEVAKNKVKSVALTTFTYEGDYLDPKKPLDSQKILSGRETELYTTLYITQADRIVIGVYSDILYGRGAKESSKEIRSTATGNITPEQTNRFGLYAKEFYNILSATVS